MTLRRKTLLVVVLVAVGLIGALFITSRVIVLGGFAKEEQDDSYTNLARVQGALDDETSTLAGITRDWAAWDDTYQFVQDAHPEFVQSNLAGTNSFENNRVNVMAFVDLSGRVVYSKAVDLSSDREVQVPVGLLAQVAPLVDLLKSGQGASGFLSVPEGPMLVACMPILPTSGEGASRGALIFARYLNTSEIEHLSRTTLYSLAARRYDDPDLPTDFRSALGTLSMQTPTLVRPLSDVALAGYLLLKDVYGRPALVIRAEMPRSVYNWGQSVVILFFTVLVVIGLIFGVITIALFERLVLSRLATLNREVAGVRDSADLSRRLAPLRGGDEISRLARETNLMLDALQAAHEASLENEQRFRAVFENALDPFAVLSDDGLILDVNPAACALMGVPAEQLKSTNVADFLDGPGAAVGSELMNALLVAGEARGDLEVRRPDGERRSVEYYARAQFLPGMSLVAVRDITQRKALEQELERQAFHDSLTGLPNRALFLDRLSHALSLASRNDTVLALLFLDLDDFKRINDSLGHRTGDLLLAQVAARLKTCVRDADTLARLGGDEFTILLEDVEQTEYAVKLAERVAVALKQPFNLGGTLVFISASTGIVVASDGLVDRDDFLRNADMAMYAAKHRGKARYAIYDPDMDHQARERLGYELELRRALEHEEFVIAYQPVVDLSTGKVVEIEALVRWDHPTRGRIRPAEFIQVAEESGLIVLVGNWVLEAACRQMRDWQRAFPHHADVVLSVNFSVRQMQQPTVIDDIKHILRITGLAPSRLKLEITEGVALDASGLMDEVLARLQQLGVKLAIDDFGTGYSALGYLKRFRFDSLKIDRSFIEGMGERAEDSALVRAVIAFAKTLGVTVTAEGIETPDQVFQLLALGCDLGQGYYFARPMPASEMRVLLDILVRRESTTAIADALPDLPVRDGQTGTGQATRPGGGASG